jgi:hypothetical protein
MALRKFVCPLSRFFVVVCYYSIRSVSPDRSICASIYPTLRVYKYCMHSEHKQYLYSTKTVVSPVQCCIPPFNPTVSSRERPARALPLIAFHASTFASYCTILPESVTFLWSTHFVTSNYTKALGSFPTMASSPGDGDGLHSMFMILMRTAPSSS